MDKKKNRRPLQGIILAIFHFILFGVIASTFTAAMIGRINEGLAIESLSKIFSVIGMIIFLALEILIIRGFFKGIKWTTILSLIFIAIGLIASVLVVNIILIPLFALLLWANIICLKRPFYNKKNHK